MTIIVNLYGGPGSGKSVTAAYTFALAKSLGINAELVSEYVKQWAWEGRQPVNYDQFYFFGQQSRREYCLFNKVELIVSDSPVALCGYFAQVFGSPSQALCFRHMVNEYYSMLEKSGVTCLHVFLNRKGTYDSRGRFQTEEEAMQMDMDQQSYLKSLGFDFITLDADSYASQEILNKVKEMRD
jgi:hypothetical protein